MAMQLLVELTIVKCKALNKLGQIQTPSGKDKMGRLSRGKQFFYKSQNLRNVRC